MLPPSTHTRRPRLDEDMEVDSIVNDGNPTVGTEEFIEDADADADVNADVEVDGEQLFRNIANLGTISASSKKQYTQKCRLCGKWFFNNGFSDMVDAEFLPICKELTLKALRNF
jgi:hypothetical protein